MARALIMADSEIKRLTAHNLQLIPKAQAYEVIADLTGTKSMNSVSKELHIGEHKLFKYLREKKILYKGSEGYTLPYQRYCDQGLFIVKECLCHDGEYRPATRVTQKGLLYIQKLMQNDEYYAS